jgi:SAM-dependent methyltransferase
MIKKRNTCRLCESKDLQLIYKMPASPPVDNFRVVGESEISLPNFPMDLYLCNVCGHAQLLDIVDPDILYGNYIYTSSSSSDLDSHFKEYAESIVKYFKYQRNDKVLDIGSNDGLLLSKFATFDLKVLGIDPSSYVASKATEKGIPTVVSYFNKTAADKLLTEFGAFDLVTANNVFSHADNLREFAECVCSILSESGAFIFEVSYLKDLVENMVIDYIYHEHLCHHSIKPLKQFLNTCGLKLIYVERVNTKGGSIRCYVVKTNNPRPVEVVVDQMISDEIASGLYNIKTYRNIESKMGAVSKSLQDILVGTLGDGGTVAVYGASATCTVLSAIMDLSQLTSFIVDDNPDRQKRLSPGYMVPVLAPIAITQYQPTFVVILAWRFAEEIINRNRDYLELGGTFIVPLPKIELIQNEKN